MSITFRIRSEQEVAEGAPLPSPVGYGRPPKGSRFKPGQSGNPKGRPKGAKNLATEIAEELSEKLTVTEGGKPIRITKQRAMIKALMAKTLKGDVRAAMTLLRLVPEAEQARQSEAQAQLLSVGDQEILATFRAQIAADIGTPKGERS